MQNKIILVKNKHLMLKYRNIKPSVAFCWLMLNFILLIQFSISKSVLIPEENIILPPGCSSYSECIDSKNTKRKNGAYQKVSSSDISAKSVLKDKKISKELKKFYALYLKNSIKCHIDSVLGMSDDDFCKNFLLKMNIKSDSSGTQSPSIPIGSRLPSQNYYPQSFDGSAMDTQGFQSNNLAKINLGIVSSSPKMSGLSVNNLYPGPCAKNYGNYCCDKQLNLNYSSSFGPQDMNLNNQTNLLQKDYKPNREAVRMQIPGLQSSALNNFTTPSFYNNNSSFCGNNISTSGFGYSKMPSPIGQCSGPGLEKGEPQYGANKMSNIQYYSPPYNSLPSFDNLSYNNLSGSNQIPFNSVMNKNFDIPNNFDYQGCINNFISCIEKIKKKKLKIS